MPEAQATTARFHGIFSKLAQLELADRMLDDIYAEDGEANFWNDYCGEDLSDIAQFRPYLRPGLQVLELACGAGRIGIELAREGAWVDGLERSPAMLRLAELSASRESAEVAARLRFMAGDMAQFALGRRYGLIVLGATSLCLLLDAQQRAGLLACVREHLAPGGRFVFDLADIGAGKVEAEFIDVYSRPSAQGQDFAIVGQRLDPATGLLHLNVYRERIDWCGETRRTLGASIKAHVDPDELRGLIHRSGLRIEHERHEGKAMHFCVMAAADDPTAETPADGPADMPDMPADRAAEGAAP